MSACGGNRAPDRERIPVGARPILGTPDLSTGASHARSVPPPVRAQPGLCLSLCGGHSVAVHARNELRSCSTLQFYSRASRRKHRAVPRIGRPDSAGPRVQRRGHIFIERIGRGERRQARMPVPPAESVLPVRKRQGRGPLARRAPVLRPNRGVLLSLRDPDNTVVRATHGNPSLWKPALYQPRPVSAAASHSASGSLQRH